MKLWQKIYLLTICLFVVLLNIGIYLVFNMTYQKNLSDEQRRAESEYSMIASSILRNLHSLERQQRFSELPIQSILEVHEKYYANQDIYLTFWKDGKCFYPEGGIPPRVSLSETESQTFIQGNRGKTVRVQSMLYKSREKYYLRYEKAVPELDIIWNQLEKKYLKISLGFSLGLAVLLFLLLKRIMKPIRDLTQAVDEMRSGNMSARVSIRGFDDISVLGEHFNGMAEKIQEDILLNQKEAQAKQQLVDNFAHELKSPITSIYGFAEYIQKANVPEEEINECMEFIMEEGTRLLKLSYMLLDMAQMRGKQIEMQNMSMGSLYDGIRRPLEKIGEDFDVKVEFYCEEEVIVQGNEILLQSLLYNLVQNGIFACHRGGTVTVSAESVQGKIRVIVEDNGCGMSQEELGKIMEPFYRGDQARNREEGRSGLGLSLCRQIVDLHKARMYFISEENRGTKVIVSFAPIGCFTG